MDNFNTLPMPEGFGKQVETPQGWRFRHCATFFVGNMCPDCHKLGFIAAAASLNEPVAATEVVPEPGADTQEPGEQTGDADPAGDQTQDAPPADGAPSDNTEGASENMENMENAGDSANMPASAMGGKQTRKQKQ
jgi:hypothetical protein